ncbi:MAG TPA: DUF2277 domain-containing protein [Bryobacteraceae bacterium]|nr:DUF2277 domain-containing protein [Bryobacteraceae bacterium]
MCRSIKVLRKQSPPATGQEVAAAALQFVRKVSGTRKPSNRNQCAFDQAVNDIAAITGHLLHQLESPQAASKRLAQNPPPLPG